LGEGPVQLVGNVPRQEFVDPIFSVGGPTSVDGLWRAIANELIRDSVGHAGVDYNL